MVVRKTPNEISEALNTISYRIEKTESDFLGHLQKVENKLEQIAELTRTVALLQQQTNQQTEQLSEVRTQVREYSSKLDGSIARIHTRFDEITSHTRDRIELSSKEIELQVKKVEEKASNTEKEFKQWLNRGLGAWGIVGIIAIAVQTGFYRWIDSGEKERSKLEAQVAATAQVAEKHNQQIEQILTLTRENQVTAKKNEQQLIDFDKRLEVIRSTSAPPSRR